MTTNIGDFFNDSNNISGIIEKEYSHMPLLISAVEAFARSTYKYVYMIDYYKKDFMYISNNLLNTLNLRLEQIKEVGYNIFSNFIPEDEQEMILEINNARVEFFKSQPVEDHKEWILTYDTHIISGKHKRLVNHTITPIYLTKDGDMWIALCTIALSPNNEPGNIIMRKVDSNTYYEYSLSTHKWNEKRIAVLSQEEKDVLILSTQGYTMTEISEKMCKSVDTIKSYKRKIFTKLNVNNISEAIGNATNYKLL
ncbi:MAG: LuxR C-terminal-related transcriptional regulator [bacterium]